MTRENSEVAIQSGKALVAHVDGCCQPNPGAGGCGIILRDATGVQLVARAFYLGDACTCNVAEFSAVAKAAEGAKELGATSLEIFSDSRLTVMVLSGRWRAKLPHLQELRDEALTALNRIPHWQITWVPREMNEAADTIAGLAVKCRRDLDYSGREIFEGGSTYAARVRGAVRDYLQNAKKPRIRRRQQRRGSIYPSACFCARGVRR